MNEIKDLTEKITYEKNLNDEREKKNESLNENIENENNKLLGIEGELDEKTHVLEGLDKDL